MAPKKKNLTPTREREEVCNEYDDLKRFVMSMMI
jgi:hypothetical protein